MRKGMKILMTISILMAITNVCLYFFFKEEYASLVPSHDLRTYILLGIEGVFVLLFFFSIGTSNRKSSGKVSPEKQERLEISNTLIKCLEENIEYVGKDGSAIGIGLIKYGNVKNPVTFTNKYTEEKIFEDNVIGKKLEIIAPALSIAINDNNETENVFNRTVKIRDSYYDAIIDRKKRTIYLNDITTKELSIRRIKDTRSAIIIVSVDNMTSLDKYAADQRAEITHKFFKSIHAWIESIGFDDLFTLSDSGDKQVYLLKESDVKKITNSYDKQKLFNETLRHAKDIDADITVSIGIGVSSDNYETLGFYAEQALAEGQLYGGNTVVIYDGKKMQDLEAPNDTSYRPFIKTTTFEPTKNIIKLVKNSSSVLIIPPKSITIDAFASSMAMHEICESLGTPSSVMFSKDNADKYVNSIYEISTFEDVSFHESLVSPETVRKREKGKMLVIYVGHDTEEESLYSGFVRNHSARIIIDNIDNASRASMRALDEKDFIIRQSAKMINCNIARGDVHYNDATVSSVTQLVAEIAANLPFEFKLKEFTATVMLAALEFRTSGFRTGTNAETFTAASFLMEHGASSSEAKSFLRDDVNENKRKTDIQSLATQIKSEYSNDISLVYTDFDKKMINGVDSAMDATKILLQVENAEYAFVIWKEKSGKDTCFVTYDSETASAPIADVFQNLKRFKPSPSPERKKTYRFAIQGFTINDVKNDLVDAIYEKYK